MIVSVLWSSSDWQPLRGSSENRLDPSSLKTDVVRSRGVPRCLVRGRKREGGLEPSRKLRDVERVDEYARSPGSRTQAGLRNEVEATTVLGRRHPFEDRLSERLEKRWRADDVGRPNVRGDSVMRESPHDCDALTPLET